MEIYTGIRILVWVFGWNNPSHTRCNNGLRAIGASTPHQIPDTHLYNISRDAACASILQLKDHRIIGKLDGQRLAAAIKIGGDAVASLKSLGRYASQAGITEEEAVFSHANAEDALSFFTQNAGEREMALLHAAKNRHALDIIPTMLDLEGADATQVTSNKESVAHLLMKYTPVARSESLEGVLIKLFDHGLDPALRDLDGCLPGMAKHNDAIVGHDVFERAIARWQMQVMETRTPQAKIRGTPRRRL